MMLSNTGKDMDREQRWQGLHGSTATGQRERTFPSIAEGRNIKKLRYLQVRMTQDASCISWCHAAPVERSRL